MSDDLSINAQLALADARLRVLNREPFTRDEYRALMRHLREDREAAARTAATNRSTAKKIVEKGAPKLALDQFFPGMRATGDDNGSTEQE